MTLRLVTIIPGLHYLFFTLKPAWHCRETSWAVQRGSAAPARAATWHWAEVQGQPSNRSKLSAGQWQCVRPEPPAVSWGKRVPCRATDKGPSCPRQMMKASAPAHSVKSTSEETAQCCPCSMASRRKPVPTSWWLWWKVRLSLPPPLMQYLLELTHHWPCFPDKLGALALPAPCNMPLASSFLFSSL